MRAWMNSSLSDLRAALHRDPWDHRINQEIFHRLLNHIWGRLLPLAQLLGPRRYH